MPDVASHSAPAPRLQSEAVRRRFVGPDGQPTAFAYQVAADIGRGVAALHERGIVHRDLKPQNVLLTESGRCASLYLLSCLDSRRGLCFEITPPPLVESWHGRESHCLLWLTVCRAKLSDMGLSKRLAGEQLSFESVGSGGSSGWQAPEQLISRSGGTARQTNSGECCKAGTWAYSGNEACFCLSADAACLDRPFNRFEQPAFPLQWMSSPLGCCCTTA